MDRTSFDDLNDEGKRIEDELNGFDFTLNDDDDSIDDLDSSSLNEYGEVEDDDEIVDTDDVFIENVEEQNPITHTTQSSPFSLQTHTTNPLPKLKSSWLKRSYLAPNETDKEFELFKIFCKNPGGRSMDYISRLS